MVIHIPREMSGDLIFIYFRADSGEIVQGEFLGRGEIYILHGFFKIVRVFVTERPWGRLGIIIKGGHYSVIFCGVASFVDASRVGEYKGARRRHTYFYIFFRDDFLHFFIRR